MKFTQLDEVLGAPARLAILATVAERSAAGIDDPWTFMELREETGLADGNLHVQARKLVEAGYLNSYRTPRGNRLVTCFDLTEAGRRSLQQLLDQLRDALGERGEGGWSRGGAAGGSRGEASRVW